MVRWVKSVVFARSRHVGYASISVTKSRPQAGQAAAFCTALPWRALLRSLQLDDGLLIRAELRFRTFYALPLNPGDRATLWPSGTRTTGNRDP